MPPLLRRVIALVVLLAAGLGREAVHATPAPVPLGAPQLWQRAEWRIDGVPDAANNFDPDVIRLDALLTTPSGRVFTVPAFWFQDFTGTLVDGAQVLAPRAAPEWRVRFTPDEAGDYALTLRLVRPGQAEEVSAAAHFHVPAETAAARAANSPRGWTRVAADRRSFATSEGRPLRLIGENACWGGARGTFDFEAWFAALDAAGGNVVRLWCAPWSMGLEHKPGTLNRYDLAAAWEADHALDLAGRHGLHVILVLDHHGMFMANDPAWGGSNNFWTRSSPYAVENGGPCANPNDFFSRDDARRLYEKRLRYLVARYGAAPQLLSWQFFNEIDNSYRPRSALVGDDVVAWHRAMGRWLRAHDPYGHLISTSLTGASDRAEFWTLPELDFAVYHSYGEADPARHLARVSADLARRYDKPVMIGEFGTNHLNWNLANDPYLRGYRQGLWGGTLGGSTGTPLPWWWESIHADDAYPLFTALRDVLARAGWNAGTWAPAEFVESGPAPVDLGEPLDDSAPFDAAIPLNQLRLNPVAGEAAVPDALAASRAAERISSYLHGTRNPQLQQHARFSAYFAERARLVFRVNSVAADADLLVRVDAEEKLRVALVNRDGLATLNDEIDREFTVELPAGKHRVEIAHAGADWVNLKAVRFERLRPATFAGGWQFTTEAIGLRSHDTAVVYVRSPHVAWPAGALRFNPPIVRGAGVTLLKWPARAGAEIAWIDPRNGRDIATTRATAEVDGALPLAVPEFQEDLVAIVRRPVSP